MSFQLTEAKKLFAILVLTLHTEYKVFVSNPLVFEIEAANHKTNLKMFEHNVNGLKNVGTTKRTK